MNVRRSDRLRKARETKQRRSSLFFRPSLLFSETAAPEQRRAMYIEPLEDRRLLAWDMTLNATATVNVSSSTVGGVTTFAATGTGANLDWNDVQTALAAGNSVVIDSGSTGTGSGNITDQTGANFTGLPGNLSLTIESGTGTNLVGDISIEGIFLDSASSSIVVDANGSVSTGLLSGGTLASPAPLASANITAGGSISAQTSPLPGPISAVNVNLSAVTGIGASGNDLPISATNLTSDTSSGNGNQFLSATGAVNLNAANALNAGNGTITLDGGTFQIQAAAGGNAIADTSSLTVNSPAALDLAGNSESIDGLSGNGTVTSSVAGPETLTVGANGGGGSFNGLIQNGAGTVQLTKTGAGTEVFSSNNTYGGVTLVNGGVLNIQSGGALGSTSAGTTVAAGAALQIQGGISVGEPLTLNGNGVSNDGALRNMATNNFWSGTITLASDSTIGGTSGVGNELVLFNSIGQSGGARSLDVVGPISLVMQGGANAYTGTTTVVSASLRLRGTQIQGPMVIGDGVNGGSVVLDASNQINDASSVTVNGDGSLILGASGSVSETIDRLIGSGTVTGAGTPGADSLTIGANGGSATFSGLIQNGAATTTLSITKIGGGAEILTGANTYSGGTTVNAGTLLVNNIAGSGTGSGTVNVNNNAALGGTGVISGPVNLNNTAHLAPGAGAGILGTGSVAFGGGTNFDVDINGPSVGVQYDQLVVTGSAALGGANLSLTGAYTPVAGDSFTILQTSAGVTPAFSGLPQGAVLFFNLQPLAIDYTANGNKNVVLSYDSTPTIEGGVGADDFTVSLDGSGNVVVKDGATTVMVTPQSSLSGLIVNGNGGANTLTVDESNGILNIPVTFNGGGTGSLTVTGYSGVQVTDTYTSTGPGHSGTVQIGAGGLISYTGLAPLTLSGTASDLIIDLSQTGVANSVVVADDGSAADPDATNNANTSAIYSTTNAFEYTQFTNPTNSLTVDLGNSGDTIAVQSMDAAFAPAGAAPFTINGGSGGDTYNVLATQDVGGGGYGSLDITAGGGNDTFNVSSNAPTNTGNLSAIVSTLNIDGGAGANTLNVSESGSGSPDTVLVTSSQIASAITPFTINYLATGGTFGGGVNLSTGSADDTINVQSTLAGGTTTINTGNGNDTINVSGPLSGAVSILGGSQTTADVLNYDAGGQDVTLSANSIIAGAGQALVFSGIEQVNITNVGGVTVLGDGNANTLTLTRTGATTDAYQLDSAAPVSLDGATSFTFFGLGGADHMQINETAAGLPQFTGTAQFSHTNSAFAASSLAPGNVGIDFSGVATASLGVNFLNSHDVTYFDDNASSSKSGVVNVAGQFTLSFDGMAPVNFTGAGGTLTVNTLADPTNTNLTVADDGTPGDGVSQITGDGGFETTTFSGFNNLVVQGLNAVGEMITLAGLDSATTLSNVTLQGGAGFDIINVQSLPATVAAALLGGGGGNNFKFDNVSHNLQQIAGPVVVSPAGDVGAVGNALFLYDYGDATSRTVQVTSSTIEGITGFAGGPDVTYGAGSPMNSVSILGGGGGNTFNVQSTRAGTSYYVNSGAGDDTVNVSSTAPAVNGNGTLTGDLNGIQGELDLVSGIGNDTLNVSDYGGAGRNYTVASPGAGVTQISASSVANIVYNFAGGSQLEHFNLVGASAGGNTYNILNTTATVSNVVSDGDASASGNSTFNIQADQLQAGASNSFNGFAGDDTFNLNFAAGATVPSAPGTTLSIDGGGLATGNDRVNVNANQAGDGFRNVQINYGAGNAVALGGLGTASVIQVNGTRQVNYYGDSAGDDQLQITTPATGAHTLSVTPISANSADVFLDGSPLLAGTATATNNPGVAGGGAGPDLFVGGLDQFLFNVIGGSSGPGIVNKLIVNAPTENLNGASTTSAWGGNAFGSLPSIQPAGSAFNDINVSDSLIDVFNNSLGDLLNVNIGPGGFVPAGVFPAPATVIVNSGDQSGTCGCGIADDIFVSLSPVVHFQVNGGTPPTSAAPNGDQLNVFTPNDVEIWSDAATPPNVSIGSSGLLPVTYSSIERLQLFSGNGIANVYGDN
ncbi:MAG TPA: autotransporter-associated beta strand repeat-containing protein, partial [Pirellulales bacterium]|nr:autotransporter-associated beta strand repeat-containing protein [Pirellulales bacterium]